MEENPTRASGWHHRCYGIGAHVAYIYVATSFTSPGRSRPPSRRRSSGYLGRSASEGLTVEVYVHSGAGALHRGGGDLELNLHRGPRGSSPMKPPFPANAGAFGCPSTVNNLETIAAVPSPSAWAARSGASSRSFTPSATRACGSTASTANVKKGAVVELAVGPTLERAHLRIRGGVQGDRRRPLRESRRLVDAHPPPAGEVNAPDPKSALHPTTARASSTCRSVRGDHAPLRDDARTCCVTVIAEGPTRSGASRT